MRPKCVSAHWIAVVLLAPAAAQATVLTFDTGVAYTQYAENGEALVQAHGDRAISTAQGPHSYSRGTGWTPNVTLDYSPAMEFRIGVFDWGDLSQPVAVTYDGRMEITLSADEGWEVVLESLEVASRNGDRTVESVVVWPETSDESMFLESNVAAPLAKGKQVAFPSSVRGKVLRLEIATGDPAGWDWVGIDELSFSQIPAGGYALGDANLDHAVNLDDFGILKANFGKAFASAAWDRADFNSDRKVDLEDFGMLKSSFGNRSSVSAVPEPSSRMLVLVACSALLFVRGSGGALSYVSRERSFGLRTSGLKDLVSQDKS